MISISGDDAGIVFPYSKNQKGMHITKQHWLKNGNYKGYIVRYNLVIT